MGAEFSWTALCTWIPYSAPTVTGPDGLLLDHLFIDKLFKTRATNQIRSLVSKPWSQLDQMAVPSRGFAQTAVMDYQHTVWTQDSIVRPFIQVSVVHIIFRGNSGMNCSFSCPSRHGFFTHLRVLPTGIGVSIWHQVCSSCTYTCSHCWQSHMLPHI